jgi:hypothetical protein
MTLVLLPENAMYLQDEENHMNKVACKQFRVIVQSNVNPFLKETFMSFFYSFNERDRYYYLLRDTTVSRVLQTIHRGCIATFHFNKNKQELLVFIECGNCLQKCKAKEYIFEKYQSNKQVVSTYIDISFISYKQCVC